jgi:hypothetical protein
MIHDWRNAYIIMRRVGPGVPVCETEWNDWGCGQLRPSKVWRRHPEPGIKYPALGSNRDGKLCFMWDDKLLNATPGRWDGELFYCDKRVATLKFLLGPRHQITGVECVPVDECPTCKCEQPCEC